MTQLSKFLESEHASVDYTKAEFAVLMQELADFPALNITFNTVGLEDLVRVTFHSVPPKDYVHAVIGRVRGNTALYFGSMTMDV